MPQTIESIRLAQESKCELLIALNKVDKVAGQEAQVRIRKIKESLLAYNIQTEDLGGDVQVVEISALKRLNLDLLLDKLWTIAELLQLKGDPSGLSESYVVESYQDRHRGKLATVIVKRGRLRRGDVLVSGTALCRVKQLFDHQLNLVDEAGLSDAVQIMGWKELPSVSDECLQMANDDVAKQLIETRLKRIELSKQNRDQVEINKKASMHSLVYKDLLSEKKRLGLKRKTTMNNPLIKG
jgi:translation initiation factor IF-2